MASSAGVGRAFREHLFCRRRTAHRIRNQQMAGLLGKPLDEVKTWTNALFIPTTALVRWPRGIARRKPGSPLTLSAVSVVQMAYFRWFHVRAIPSGTRRTHRALVVASRTILTTANRQKTGSQLLLDVTKSSSSQIWNNDVLRAISASVRRVMQCDVAYVCLARFGCEQVAGLRCSISREQGIQSRGL